MKPGDHPDFFRLPAPPGRSRESTLALDRHGRWSHDGEPVEHPGLLAALPRWVTRHPDDGRPILANGYDWCYFAVEATPFFIETIEPIPGGAGLALVLSDGTREPLDLETLRLDDDGVLRCGVKGRTAEARFGRLAQLALEPWLVDSEPPAIEVGGRRHPIA